MPLLLSLPLLLLSHSALQPLLQAIGETQLFERFVRDRWSPNGLPTKDDSTDVKLFDDLIVAKLNRSNFHKSKVGQCNRDEDTTHH